MSNTGHSWRKMAFLAIGTAVIIISAAITIALWTRYVGPIVPPITISGGQYIGPSGQVFETQEEFEQAVTDQTTLDYGAVKLQWSVVDGISDSAISTTTTKVDLSVVRDGVVDFLSKIEPAISVDSSPEQSASYYAYGASLVVHVMSDTNPTGGADFYDGWFYVTLIPNDAVRELSVACLTPLTTGTYTYALSDVGVDTGFSVQYTGGDTPYWDIGSLELMPRISDANFDAYLMYGGTTLASVTDGTTWVDTQAEQSNDVDLSTTSESLFLKVDAGATSVTWGHSMYTVSQYGKFEERVGVVLVTTNCTAIGVGAFQDEGWSVLSDSTLTSEKGFYKVLNPDALGMVPSKGNDWEVNIEIPLDTSSAASSTRYSLNVWILDFQKESSLSIGAVTTTVPTAYGMVSEYGLDAMVYPRAYTTSSGAGSGMALFGDYRTP